jgi:hypothetical protein
MSKIKVNNPVVVEVPPTDKFPLNEAFVTLILVGNTVVIWFPKYGIRFAP